MTCKYHREVWFEDGAEKAIRDVLEKAVGQGKLDYSGHAKLATIRDRYGIIPILTLEDIRQAELFEYVRDGKEITKAVFRVKHTSPELDYSYSVSREGTVITCWANSKEDIHTTLDETLYKQKPKET